MKIGYRFVASLLLILICFDVCHAQVTETTERELNDALMLAKLKIEDPLYLTYVDTEGVIRFGDDGYYQAHCFYSYGRGDGLVAENFSTKTFRVYRMFGLAEAAGWFKRNVNDGWRPDATRGLFRVGNTLWMGSNGIGVAVFDFERKTWSRYGLRSSVVMGDKVGVDYADDDYVFVTAGEFPGASMHIYLIKQDRWLGLKAVSTKLVRKHS